LRLILRHIEAEQVIQPHDELRERDGHFCFSDSRRTEKEETAEGPPRLSQPELAAPENGRDTWQRVILTDNLTAQVTLQRAEFRKFGFVFGVHRFARKPR
jgi:hypothetical protein